MKLMRLPGFVSVLGLWYVIIGAGVAFANDPPVIECPAPIDPAVMCNHHLIDGGDGIFNLGDLVTGTASVSDPNDDLLTLSVISILRDGEPDVPVNTPGIDNNGDFFWQTTPSDPEGVWQFCLEVSDGELADTCCFDVELSLKFYLSIRDVTGTVDTISSLDGQNKDIYVNLSPAVPLRELHAQVRFNDAAVFFRGPATPINNLADWEYFTYRVSFDTSCAGAEAMGLISIDAVADLDNGSSAIPPESSYGLDGNIVHLPFTVTQDWNFLGQCLPFDFCSVDCDDNRLVSKDGSIEYLPLEAGLECLTSSTVANIQTCNGGICVRSLEPILDVNLNGIEPEIGDVVLMISYFLYGDIILDPVWMMVQKQAMDCNNDGFPGTFADLICMIRIITGEIDKYSPNSTSSVDIMAQQGDRSITISAASAAALGGGLFTFQYDGVEVRKPRLAQPLPGMTVKSFAGDGELRVLLMPSVTAKAGVITPGHNELLDIPFEGNGTVVLKSIDLADASGEVLPGRILEVGANPWSYALLQNYPNPFNAGTVIPFDLQDASEWELTIYNIMGQTVRSFSGLSGASRVEVHWDGADSDGRPVASGMYFYRVRAGDFVATRKMTLLK